MHSSNATWQLQHAKARFSEVVRAAQRAPQIVTLKGRETVVVMSHEFYLLLLKIMQKTAKNASVFDVNELEKNQKAPPSDFCALTSQQLRSAPPPAPPE